MQKRLAIIKTQSNNQFEYILKDDKFSRSVFKKVVKYWYRLAIIKGLAKVR